MPETHVLEGTWDELVLHADELRRDNKRLRIQIIDDTADSGTPEKSGQSLSEMLGDYIGAIHSGGAESLSENTGDRFTDYLVEKRRAGTL
jgi:hypothetical protein